MIRKIFICLCLMFYCLIPMQQGDAKNILSGISDVSKIIHNFSDATQVIPVEIYPDGKYHNGIVSYSGQKETEKNLVKARYNLYLHEPTTLKLHFISHVDHYVQIEMRDADENKISPFSTSISITRSPFTQKVTLDKGSYMFSVIKVRRLGSNYNSGDYRFKFEKIVND